MAYDGTLTFATALDASGFEAGLARLAGIVDNLALPVDRQGEWGRLAGSAFTGGFEQTASGLPGMAAGILEQAAAHSRDVGVSAFRQVGAMLASGLAGGISAGQSGVVNAILGSVNAAIGAAKNRLGIRSPSQLFRDEVGRMIMTGWADGIADGTGETVAAAQGAAWAVQKAAQGMPATLPMAGNLQLPGMAGIPGTAISEGGAATTPTQVTNLTQNIHSGVALSPAEMTREAENFLRRAAWQLN